MDPNNEYESAPEDEPPPAGHTIDLDFLATHTSEVFNTHDHPLIQWLVPRQLQFRPDGATDETTIIRSHNLIHTARSPGLPLIPPNAHVFLFLLDLLRVGGDRPHLVELTPTSVKLEDPADAPLIIQWARKIRLPGLQLILRLLAAFLLALTPNLPDDDTSQPDKATTTLATP